ncbi:MAG TPA: transcription-repair coupling factor [Elusimicrobiota bacterium]|nr:transcription-repair coupling factor [Elusimicrobiota bacterium]
MKKVVGAPGSGARALLARRLLAGTSPAGLSAPNGPLVFVLPDADAVEDMADAVKALAPLFEGRSEPVAVFADDARERLASLELLRAGARLALATPEGLQAPAPARADFSARTVRFRAGDRSPRDSAIEALAAAGYQRVDFVESPGEFAVRGAILDFHALEPAIAYRVLYDEDRVASIRPFDPVSQEPSAVVAQAAATPAEEPALGARVADWLADGASWLVGEGVETQVPEGVAARVIAGVAHAGEGDVDFGAKPLGPYAGDPKNAWAEMKKDLAAGLKVLLFSLNNGEDARLQELLSEEIPGGAVQFLIGPLREGFRLDGEGLAVYATSQVFERDWRGVGRWKRFAAKGEQSVRWRELKNGDFVVHQEYGIARYDGMEPVSVPGHGAQDCVKLEFRGSDRLYVPLTEFGRIQKYSGVEGKRPRLSSLDTRTWEEVKRQVAEGVRELAEELLKLQAKRAAQPGHVFPPENEMEREFANSFPFELTEDQAKAIHDTLEDMMTPKPMDRLVVGDVGFGKTEVAMRAAFKCAMGLKQCAVLAPTTVLADQHYRTFAKRMAGFPVKLAIMTRFQTKAEQKKTLEDLKSGKIDVVIGTARLLQKDVKFHDLGLVIVDEEHRFGVGDKEKLKKVRVNADILSLSATPIPRSLHQALTGLRGISLIETAPTGRQPIVTRVGPWDERVISTAIAEELARGGQVYYVHNRVRSMKDAAQTIQRLAGGARVAVVHGQMRGAEIEKAMWDLAQRKSDVLVASTIIESGLDIPTVNTLLVEDAQNFGLAQLYQLRGRVGRERQRAYCYLFHPPDAELKDLPEDTVKRLDALKEFGALGAGIKLAMRDLEIRGAGDLLGARQHGFMNAVGADYYSQMLESEVMKMRGKEVEDDRIVSIDLKLPAFLPEDYLPGEIERLKLYKRALRAAPEEGKTILEELERLSGPAPQPVKNLFELLALRALARRARVDSIVEQDKAVEIRFRPDAPPDPGAPARWLKAFGERVSFVPSSEGDAVRLALEGRPAAQAVREFLAA